MAHVDHRVACCIDLVKDEISEQLDNVAISCFGPSMLLREAVVGRLAQ